MMKNLFFTLMFIASLTILTSCEKEECPDGTPRGATPSAPYGTPDDSDTYTNEEYISVTYTYYCYNGKYRSVSYSSIDKCTPFTRSDFTSSCIKKY